MIGGSRNDEEGDSNSASKTAALRSDLFRTNAIHVSP